MTTDRVEIEGVPGWLTAYPESTPTFHPMPTEDLLPFDRLAWPDFERLCWRLVRSRGDVRYCAIYGTPGQAQHGIDIYSDEQRGWAVYQCRRIKELSANGLRQAVDDFLNGQWAGRAKVFSFCTSTSLRDTSLAEEVFAQSVRLRERNITFEPLDAEQLSVECRRETALVWDFFGPAWTEAFCGVERSKTLGNRMTPAQAARLRLELESSYRRIFARHDVSPGPLEAEAASEYLRTRFAARDVAMLNLEGVPARTDDSPHQGESSAPAERLGTSRLVRYREDFDSWFARHRRAVLLGGPGSGKSTLLRNVATELLSKEPRLPNIAAAYSGSIPVWLPFSAYVREFERGPDSARPPTLREFTKRWFASYNCAHLHPLLDHAFEDGRLLLLVDGLDEYTDAEAAQRAFAHLVLEQQQLNSALLASGREAASSHLARGFPGWNRAEVAPLSPSQARSLIDNWFQAKGEQEAERQRNDFARALAASPDATQISDTPLMLVFLLETWSNSRLLAKSKVDLLDSTIDLLTARYPAIRRTAAESPKNTDILDEDELRGALAYLALKIQTTTGDLTPSLLHSFLCEFAEEPVVGLGQSAMEARKSARSLSRAFLQTLGMLVSDGERIQFLHRSLLEHLAGEQLSRLPATRLEEIVRAFGSEPGWASTWVVALSKARDAQIAEALFLLLERALQEAPHAYHLVVAITEAAASGKGPLATPVRARWLETTARQIRTQTWRPNRPDVARAIVAGLNNPKATDSVQGLLEEWIPAIESQRSPLVANIGRWSPATDVDSVLQLAVRDEDDPAHAIAAARALAARGQDVPSRLEHLIELACTDHSPSVRAVALIGLAGSGAQCASSLSYIGPRQLRFTPELAVGAMLFHASSGHRVNVPPFELLRLFGIGHNSIAHAFRPALRELIVLLFRGDGAFKNEVIELLQEEGRGSWVGHRKLGYEIDGDEALRLLLEMFPGDDQVASTAAKRMDSLYLSHSVWELLAAGFRGHALFEEIARKVAKERAGMVNERAKAALVWGADDALGLLVQLLPSPFSWHYAEALVQGWGSGDERVHIALTRHAASSPARAAEIAHLLPLLEPDTRRTRARLLGLLQDTSVSRIDFVLSTLADLHPGDDEVASVGVASVESRRPRQHWDAARWPLFRTYSWHKDVQGAMRRALKEAYPPLTAIAAGAEKVLDLRAACLRAAAPLGAELRREIWGELARISPACKRSRAWLERYSEETDPEARTTAAQAFVASVRTTAWTRLPAIRESLVAGVAQTGMEYESGRQAALAAALELGLVDILRPACEDKEAGGPPRRAVSISRGYRPYNRPFLSILGSHWEPLSTTYGPDLLALLGAGHVFEEAQTENILFSDSTFEALLAVGLQSASLRDRILRLLESAPRKRGTPAILEFIGRFRPSSRLLLDYCLGTLRGDPQNQYWLEVQFHCAELLWRHFSQGGAADLLDLTWEQPWDSPFERAPTLAALALCRPNDPRLVELYKGLNHAGRADDPFSAAVVTFACGETERIFELIEFLVESPVAFIPEAGRLLTLILSERVLSEDNIESQVLSFSKRSSSHLVAVLPLLARLGACRPEMGSVLRNRLAAEALDPSPDLVLDVFRRESMTLLARLCLDDSHLRVPE